MGAGGLEDGSSDASMALASGAQMTKRSGEARRFRAWGALAFAGGLILGCANSAQVPSTGGDETARGAVTTRPQTSAAAQEQAKADAYAQQAALYAHMATSNSAAASA